MQGVPLLYRGKLNFFPYVPAGWVERGTNAGCRGCKFGSRHSKDDSRKYVGNVRRRNYAGSPIPECPLTDIFRFSLVYLSTRTILKKSKQNIGHDSQLGRLLVPWLRDMFAGSQQGSLKSACKLNATLWPTHGNFMTQHSSVIHNIFATQRDPKV